MELICASLDSGKRLCNALPLETLDPSGIFQTFNLYTSPLFEKKSTGVIVLAENNCVTKSSSLVTMPVLPFPPLFWDLIDVNGVL